MEKTTKVIVTILAVVVFCVLFSLLIFIREQAGASTPGILGMALLAALIAALRAVWKKPKDENNNHPVKK